MIQRVVHGTRMLRILVLVCGPWYACTLNTRMPEATAPDAPDARQAERPASQSSEAPAPERFDAPESNRELMLMNSGWRFTKGEVDNGQLPQLNDSAWTSIQLPHTFNAGDGQDGGTYYRGPGWYRKNLFIDEEYAERKVYLQFDGANIVTDVYVNGHHLGTHRGGFSRFRMDATDHVRFGEKNLVAVRVDNGVHQHVPPLSADFTFFGGLYRDVYLLVTDALQIDTLDHGSSGVYVKPTEVSGSQARLQVTAKVSNDYGSAREATVRAVVCTQEYTVVRDLSTTVSIASHAKRDVVLSTTVENPRLWNGQDDPYRYRVFVEVMQSGNVLDAVEQRVGFRSFRVDAAQGFFLNGRALDLHGVSRHQDRIDKGWATSDEDRLQDFQMIQEMGATAIRVAHYPQAPYWFDLCDQNGMIVWAEIPLVNSVTPGQEFAGNARQQLIELIRQNYNRPSIFFWGIFNELNAPWAEQPEDFDDAIQLVRQLNDLAHREDDTRLTVSASYDTFPDGDLDDITDLQAYNRYLGWYIGDAHDIGPWCQDFHRQHPQRAFGISEFGAGASIVQHEYPPQKPDPFGKWHPEEYQSSFHEVYWQALEDKPYIWCKLIWNMFDFAADERDEGDRPGRNDKGLVTYDRRVRKDAFFWYQANWSDTSVVHITERRDLHRPNERAHVKVYSNADAVQLLVDGESKGSLTSSNRIFVWDELTIPDGATVKAIGQGNGETFSDVVYWNR